MANSFVPPYIPPPPPPPHHFRLTGRSRQRCCINGCIARVIFILVVLIVTSVVVPVVMFKNFKGIRSERKPTYGLKAMDIIVGPDVAPLSPSSGTTRLLEKNMTVPSRVRRNHY